MSINKLAAQLEPELAKLNEPLAKYTTVKIGGPADIFYTPKTTNQLIRAVNLARELGVITRMLGWGANTLISDNGLRGLVIRSHAKDIVIGENISKAEPTERKDENTQEMLARWDAVTTESGGRTMYEFNDLNYDESDSDTITVNMDSGVDLPWAINHLVSKGITGLQWYSRIPATVGGAIYNNIHGGTHFIGEVVNSIKVLTADGAIKQIDKADLDFGYDFSRFHYSKEIILSVEFKLYKGDVERAKAVVVEWAKRKAIQPSKSVGCIFANISKDIQTERQYPTPSVGYVVEQVLKMTGFHVGDAYISPQHHNFIENKGNAAAADYLAVIKEIYNRCNNELGIELTPEIFLMGFTAAEISPLPTSVLR